MQWLEKYQLFLFDFDGLLVETEHFHYQAYIHMCAQRGFQLNWSFPRYSEAAHHSATALKEQIYAEFPALYAQEPDWRVLYGEKSACYLQIIERGNIPLLPGVKELLLTLQQANIKRCVVTHSAKALIQCIRRHNPLLDSIPHWITREDYANPKPDSECYQMAIEQLAKPEDNIIGFEDSPRGMEALLGTRAKPVLICPPDSAYIAEVLQKHPQVTYYPSFTAIS